MKILAVLIIVFFTFPGVAFSEAVPMLELEVQKTQEVTADNRVLDSSSAQEKPTTLFKLKDDITPKNAPSVAGNAGTVFAGLVAVLVLIAALAWASKRFNLNLPGSSADMKLISAMSVGPKEKVMLIEVEGERLLIGVTPQQINTLKTLEPNSSNSLSSDSPKNDFSQKMQAMLKAGNSHNA